MKPAPMRAIVCAILFIAACGPSSPADDDDDDVGDDGGTNMCTTGTQRCNGAVLQVCQGGVFVDGETCAQACDPTLGCVVCQPNTGTCDGDISHACRPDGAGFIDVYCDPVQGMSCGASGICEGACSPAALGETYFGCDYWPTITGNMVSATYDFAVVVSNTTANVADVTIDGGGLVNPERFQVPANSVAIRRLPWVNSLKLCAQPTWSQCLSGHPNSSRTDNGSYHLRSTQPVTVYQFNPLDYFEPGNPENSYTNDASLLFPTNAWRYEYYATTWQQTANQSPTLLAVTAYQDNTMVTITAKTTTTAEGGAPAFVAGVPQTVMLSSGDVLEIGSIAAAADLTGSHITSDKPVQVIAGHYCANVPDGFGYCDHLEESMFPVDALSNRYIINAPAVTTIPNGKENMVRIVATQAGTTLSYDPPQAGAPTTIANAGDFAEIPRQAASYMITANHKVLVAQIMEGSTAGGGTGDPAMALAVPVEQFRSNYLFHAPTNYETNYVDITAPVGATVMLDGAPITNFVEIGGSGFALARVTPLGNGPGNDGNHSISGSVPFGITVYGYGQDTSYWYPGGLNLELVPIGRLVQPKAAADESPRPIARWFAPFL